MKSNSVSDTGSFFIPSQTLRGSRQDMLATIDEAIVGLLALRHLVAGEALVLPEAESLRADRHRPNRAQASMERVGRIFSSLMGRMA